MSLFEPALTCSLTRAKVTYAAATVWSLSFFETKPMVLKSFGSAQASNKPYQALFSFSFANIMISFWHLSDFTLPCIIESFSDNLPIPVTLWRHGIHSFVSGASLIIAGMARSNARFYLSCLFNDDLITWDCSRSSRIFG
jgi:hypothetical protein